jgi:hypothetical protein
MTLQTLPRGVAYEAATAFLPVTAKQVQELRDLSQCTMMECKRALMATAGDLPAAAELLRRNDSRVTRTTPLPLVGGRRLCLAKDELALLTPEQRERAQAFVEGWNSCLSERAS